MATLLSFVRPQPRGWSNDEKAQFARIQKLLGDAGVDVDVEHGLTDEGDPWCAFCSGFSGEVIVHAARIDGQYLFDSAALPNKIMGRSLNDCAQRFIDDATVLARQPQNSSKILMHPSALLAGVMLTIFLYLETIGESSAHGRVMLELDAESDAGNKGAVLPAEAADTTDTADTDISPLLALKQMLHQITEAAQKQESDRTGGGQGQSSAQSWGTVMLPAVVAAIAYAQDSIAGSVIEDDGTLLAHTETQGEVDAETPLPDATQQAQSNSETTGDARIVADGEEVLHADAETDDAFLVVNAATPQFENQSRYVEPTTLTDAVLDDIVLSERSFVFTNENADPGQEEAQPSIQEEPITLAQVSQDISAAASLVRLISDSFIELQNETFALSDFVEVLDDGGPGIGLNTLDDPIAPLVTAPTVKQNDTLTFLPFEPVVETVSSREIADQISAFVRVTGLLRYDIEDRSHMTIYDSSVIGLEETADVTFRTFALDDSSTVTFIGFDHELDMVFA